jgi:hypothetical protein
MQIKFLTLLLGFVVIYESLQQIKSIKNENELGSESAEIFGHKTDSLNDWGLFTENRYRLFQKNYQS